MSTFRLICEQHVVIDPQFFGPAEIEMLLANPPKARKCLGWSVHASLEEFVAMMIKAQLRILRRGRGLTYGR